MTTKTDDGVKRFKAQKAVWIRTAEGRSASPAAEAAALKSLRSVNGAAAR